MTIQTADFPVREPVTTRNGLVSDRWRIWLRNLRSDVNLSTNRLAAVILDGQTASLALTPFDTDTLPEGQYRVSWFIHITTAGSVSSSLAVSVSVTHKTFVCSRTSTALTTNLTSSIDQNDWTFSIDPGSPISYSTTYAANAANSMAYSIALILEQLNTV